MKISYISATGEPCSTDGSVEACLGVIDRDGLYGNTRPCNTYATNAELMELNRLGRLNLPGNIHNTDEIAQSVAEQLGSYGPIKAGFTPANFEPLVAPSLFDEPKPPVSYAGAAGGTTNRAQDEPVMSNYAGVPILTPLQMNWDEDTDESASPPVPGTNAGASRGRAGQTPAAAFPPLTIEQMDWK